ncbi:hypothetical protein MSAN_02003600 [Mycena sanguinolenta]|uniref:Uncharacterized protein n=1 Tax=Mycena sanguinolenta TaxID=230812 RepID=A0A8H6XKV3_9AGAR|nr:hypothetical protein MSAN_02003600 [Mycena sanguinolenta]
MRQTSRRARSDYCSTTAKTVECSHEEPRWMNRSLARQIVDSAFVQLESVEWSLANLKRCGFVVRGA